MNGGKGTQREGSWTSRSSSFWICSTATTRRSGRCRSSATRIGLFIVAMLVARLRGSRSFLASHAIVDRLLPALLCYFWAWIGVVFMWGYQADISASGRPFGVLFLIGAVAFGSRRSRRGAISAWAACPSWRLAIGGVDDRLRHAHLPAARGARRPHLPVGPHLRRGTLPDCHLHPRRARLLRAASLVPPGRAPHLGLHRDDGRPQARHRRKTSASSSQPSWPRSSSSGSPRRVAPATTASWSQQAGSRRTGRFVRIS